MTPKPLTVEQLAALLVSLHIPRGYALFMARSLLAKIDAYKKPKDSDSL